jgi:hypothetical protein
VEAGIESPYVHGEFDGVGCGCEMETDCMRLSGGGFAARVI